MKPRQSRVHRAIFRARGHSATRVEFGKPTNGSITDLDRFVHEHGCNKLGDDWIEMERPAARLRLAKILGISLAYGTPVMDFRRAEELADQFLAIFDDGAKFFTNYEEWEAMPGGGWCRGGCPLTSYTFDEAVAGVDSTQIGIVVVMDED